MSLKFNGDLGVITCNNSSTTNAQQTLFPAENLALRRRQAITAQPKLQTSSSNGCTTQIISGTICVMMTDDFHHKGKVRLFKTDPAILMALRIIPNCALKGY